MRRLARTVLGYRVAAIFLAHVAVVVLSYLSAALLRFEFSIPPDEAPTILRALPVLVACRLAFFHRYHLFSGWWQYVGIRDVIDILKSTTAGTLAFVVVVVVSGAFRGFPRSIFVLEWLLTLQLLAGLRILSRLLHSVVHGILARGRRKLLIVGAGPIAESVLRDLSFHPSDRRVVGFLDDDETANGTRLRGLPRLGATADLSRVLQEETVAEVVIALPSAERARIREIVRGCRTAGVVFRVLPTVEEVLDRPRTGDLANLEELFDSDEVAVDDSLARDLFYQKTVLVLGAGGQVGSALAWEIASAQPRHLLLLDRNESPLYYLEVEFLKKLQMVPLTPLIGDLLDAERLRQVFAGYHPEVVIHAAGCTRLELLAGNATEIRRNNLCGTRNVLRAAEETGVRSVFLLSLDEERHDLFGCLHRAAEQLLRRSGRSAGGVRAAVRFPSVLGSAGCPVTALALALQQGMSGLVSAPDATARIAGLRTVVPLLIEAMGIAEDGDVLALEVGQRQRLVEVARYLRQVWNLPEVLMRTAPATPDHVHPLEVGVATRHPRIVRRRIDPELAACAVELLTGLGPAACGRRETA